MAPNSLNRLSPWGRGGGVEYKETGGVGVRVGWWVTGDARDRRAGGWTDGWAGR